MSTKKTKTPEYIVYIRRWYFKEGFTVSSDLIPVIKVNLRKLGIKAKVQALTIMPVFSSVSFNSQEDMNLFMVSGHFSRLDDELYGKPIMEYNKPADI